MDLDPFDATKITSNNNPFESDRKPSKADIRESPFPEPLPLKDYNSTFGPPSLGSTPHLDSIQSFSPFIAPSPQQTFDSLHPPDKVQFHQLLLQNDQLQKALASALTENAELKLKIANIESRLALSLNTSGDLRAQESRSPLNSLTQDGSRKVMPDLSGSNMKLNVSYPMGYNPGARRNSISGESMSPEEAISIATSVTPQIFSNAEIQELIDVVTKIPIFKVTPIDSLRAMVGAMTRVSFRAGQSVLHEGEEGSHMYVVKSGELQVMRNGQTLGFVHPGEVFGETALLYGTTRTATVLSKTDTECWKIERRLARSIFITTSMRKRVLYEGFLAKCPLFKSMQTSERNKIADALEPVSYFDGNIIIEQGAEAFDGFYIVEHGTVQCYVSPRLEDGTIDKTAASVKAIELQDGDYFGELALITNSHRAATVKAVGEVKCLRITKQHFEIVLGPLKDLMTRNSETYATYNALISGVIQKPTMQNTLADQGSHSTLDGSDAPDYNTKLAMKMVLQPFLESEISYLNDLQTLVGTFIPEVSQISKEENLMIPPDTLSTVFCSVDLIRDLHKEFYSDLSAQSIIQKSQNYFESILNILQTFISNIPDIYKNYFSSYYCSRELQYRKESPISHCIAKTESRLDLQFENLISKPLLRLGYYGQVLVELMSYTLENKEALNLIRQLTSQLRKILSQMEDVRYEAERVYNILSNIQGDFVYEPIPSRIYCYDGVVKIEATNGQSNSSSLMMSAAPPHQVGQSSDPSSLHHLDPHSLSHPVHGFAFSDMIVFCLKHRDKETQKTKMTHWKTVQLSGLKYHNKQGVITLIWPNSDHNSVSYESISFSFDQQWEQIIYRLIKSFNQQEISTPKSLHSSSPIQNPQSTPQQQSPHHHQNEMEI